MYSTHAWMGYTLKSVSTIESSPYLEYCIIVNKIVFYFNNHLQHT